MRERVFKREVGLRPVHGPQENSQNNENESAPDGVAQLIAEAFAFGHAAGDGIGQRDPNQKRKRGLDGVMKRATGPLHVALVVTEKIPEPIPGERLRDLREAQHFGHHQKHHESAIRIDGYVARRGSRWH